LYTLAFLRPMDTGPLHLLYRADGGNALGTGHLLRAVRVLAAIAELAPLDAVMAVSEDPSGIAYAQRANVPLLMLPARRLHGPKPRFDPRDLASRARLDAYDAVVVDMLDTEAGALAEVSKLGPKVITLDDRGAGRLGADAIVNFLVREPDPERLSAGTRLWEGPEYATLDPAFEAEPPPRREPDAGHARVLVSVGGGDAAGLSLKIARALTDVRGISEATFVTGSAFASARELERLTRRGTWRGRMAMDLPNLRDELLSCDLAIVAGGMTLHEACCAGAPALAVCQPIDHQIELARRFEEAGAMRSLGDGTQVSEAEIADAARALLADREGLRRMSEMGPRIVDGRGTSRTASAIIEAARGIHIGGTR